MFQCIVRGASAWLLAASALQAAAQSGDPRLQEVWYDPNAVVTVPVKRGVVTHIELDEHESITEVGSGLGADCAKPDASWCVAAQPGGRNIFVKPKTTAGAPNNLAVVTDRRSHAFRLIVLPDADARAPVYRLTVKAPVVRTLAPTRTPPPSPVHLSVPLTSGPTVEETIAERMQAAPEIVNADYSIADGKGSADIVPTLVFDDGRFTYLRFPNNREVPAVFHVLEDGSETVVNTRMEGDLLVIDRVSRRLRLRSGTAVVGVWNDAFDLDGIPPAAGTTTKGVVRALRPEPGTAAGRQLRGVEP